MQIKPWKAPICRETFKIKTLNYMYLKSTSLEYMFLFFVPILNPQSCT